jgi:E3 ubiquitin-protein ligase NEDD4
MWLPPSPLVQVEYLYLAFDDVGGTEEEDVTAANREEYVRRKVFHVLVDSRREQLRALRTGFESVELKNVLRLFSMTELMDLLCGQHHLECEDLITALEFSGFSSSSRTPDHLKALLRSWSEPDLKLFLRFVTAMTCLPADGGRVKISRDGGGATAFPKSHTCFNRLDLPELAPEPLEQRLRICLESIDDGFGEA